MPTEGQQLPNECAFCKRELASKRDGFPFTVHGSSNKREHVLACSSCIGIILPVAWELRRSLDFAERRVQIAKTASLDPYAPAWKFRRGQQHRKDKGE